MLFLCLKIVDKNTDPTRNAFDHNCHLIWSVKGLGHLRLPDLGTTSRHASLLNEQHVRKSRQSSSRSGMCWLRKLHCWCPSSCLSTPWKCHSISLTHHICWLFGKWIRVFRSARSRSRTGLPRFELSSLSVPRDREALIWKGLRAVRRSGSWKLQTPGLLHAARACFRAAMDARWRLLGQAGALAQVRA